MPHCRTDQLKKVTILDITLNSGKLVEHIIGIISSINPLSNTEKASPMFKSAAVEHGITDADFLKTPNYFDCCLIENTDWGERTIQLLLRNWPVLIMADGCSVNVLARTKLTELLGLLSPNVRCYVHAGDGSLKRMAKSQTYSVPEVKEFETYLRIFLHHFQLSGKSTHLLNEAPSNLEIKKIHKVTWYPPCMSYFLSACKLTVDNLIAICGILVSADIKKEERAYIMGPQSINFLHILADLESVFGKSYLRK